MTRLKGELEGARQELMNKENARKTLEAEVEALTAQLDAGQGEVKIVKAEVVKAQRSCMETQRVLDDLKTRQQKVREEGLKKLTARMLWKSIRFEFDAWREVASAALHLRKVSYLEEERDDRSKALEEAVATADRLERDIAALKDEMAAQQAASLEKVRTLTAEMRDEAEQEIARMRERFEEAIAAESEEKRRLKEQIDVLHATGEAEAARRMAEIGDLREKLEEAIATKEQLLKDMTKALGVKEEELAVFEERQKMNEAARQKRAIEVCSRVVGHWQHRVSGAAFESWRLHEMEQRRMRELCSRVVVKMMKRGMDAAFVFWQAQATRQRRTREVCARAVTKMQRLGVDCAFTTWREDVEEQKAERALEAAERAKAEAVVEAA